MKTPQQGAAGGRTDGRRHPERRGLRHRSRLEPHGAGRRALESRPAENLNDKAVTPHENVPETRADLCAGRDKGAERAMAILSGM